MTDDIVRISLSCTRGQDLWAVIDIADESLVNSYPWQVAWGRHGIYVRTQIRTDGRRRWMLMHRLLMDPPDDMVIDHINRQRPRQSPIEPAHRHAKAEHAQAPGFLRNRGRGGAGVRLALPPTLWGVRPAELP